MKVELLKFLMRLLKLNEISSLMLITFYNAYLQVNTHRITFITLLYNVDLSVSYNS